MAKIGPREMALRQQRETKVLADGHRLMKQDGAPDVCLRHPDKPKTPLPVKAAAPEPKATAPATNQPDAAPANKENVMRNPKAKRTPPARTPVKGKTAKADKAKAKAKAVANGKSKVAIVADLLTRKGGCTTQDVLNATGWPAVSMPAMAKSAGLTLKKEKIDGVTHYTGVAA